MNHLGLKQKLQSLSDPLKGKWGNRTNALLSPLVFKIFLTVVRLGQCSGTQSGRNTEFRQIAGYLGMAGAQVLTAPVRCLGI